MQAAQLSAETKATELRAALLTKVKQIGEELQTAATNVKESETVQNAIQAYNEETKKLSETTTADVTAKAFLLLTQAKDNVIAAIKAAAKSPIALDIEAKIKELYDQAAFKVKELEQHAISRIHEATAPVAKSEVAVAGVA